MLERGLAAGFAASAHTGDQLAQARAWLDGGPRPDGLDLDGDLRGRLLRTLAATELGAKRDDLSRGLRLVLQEQEVILRSALAARSTPRRWP